MSESNDLCDVFSSVREGRPLSQGGRYIIQVGNEGLVFSPIVIDDPVVTGRQIIEAAGKRPAEEHLIFRMLRSGVIDELRLEELVDLRQAQVERFLVFKSAESYRFELDGRVIEWGAPTIAEHVLRTLSGIPENYSIWQERRDQEDLKLSRDGSADLLPKGLERFYTGADQTTAGRGSFLPEKDRRYLAESGLSVDEVEHGEQKAIIIRNYPLPPELFDCATTDVLILLPSTWPDSGTDMFYTFPWIKLRATAGYATKADVEHPFGDRTWQRWSRHNNEWRPGRDGIWTTLRRVDAALRSATP